MDAEHTPGSPRSGRRGPGCCLFLVAVPLLLLGGALLLGGLSAGSVARLFGGQGDGMEGEVVTAVYAPETRLGGGAGLGRLWVLTDPSFYYTLSTETAGGHSVSRECLLCSLQLSVMDPVTREVGGHVTWSYDEPPPEHALVHTAKDIWLISLGEGAPGVRRFDASTGQEVWDHRAFVRHHPKLKAGLAKLALDREDQRLRLTTLDGLEFTYALSTKTLREKGAPQPAQAGEVSRFALLEEKSKARTRLFRVTGEPGRVETALLRGREDARHVSVEPLGGKVFLEAWIAHQDEESAVVIHQDSLGKTSQRRLTCVGRTGKVRWSLAGDALFEQLRVDEEEDPFSKTFFLKHKVSLERQGEVLVLALRAEGVVGLDARSGATLWELRN